MPQVAPQQTRSEHPNFLAEKVAKWSERLKKGFKVEESGVMWWH